MGIRGLKTFIENNSDLKIRFELHDCYLVIDGSNLMYSLYWKSSSSSKDYLYGGDYNRFAETVKLFFKTLQKCNIEAIVVFDGGIDPSQQKFKKIIERFRKNLEEAKRISKGNICEDRIIGSLCKPVFLEVLSQLGVRHIQASFEADSFVAKIANQLNCPVLSNDSDFFVFDLNNGVISIDCLMHSLDVKTFSDANDSTKVYKYLYCDLFLIENLIEYFPGLKREILPLFSTLMGNDWVDSYVFDNIFNAIPDVPMSRKKSKSLHVGRRHLQMIKLLNWLRNKSIEESVEFLINFLKKNSRNNALNLLQMSLENYWDGLSEHNQEKCLDLENLSSFLPNKDPSLPEWFVDEFHKSLMSTALMNIIKMKCEVLSPRIEDFGLPSSYTTGKELRQYLFALMRNNDEDIETVTIFERVGNHMSIHPLEPQLLTPNGLQILPNFHRIRTITIEERRSLFSDILSIDEQLLEKTEQLFNSEECDSNGGVFLIIILKYWIKRCNHQIWIEFIYSLLTSIMFSGYIGSYSRIKFFSFDKKEMKESVNNLIRYNVRPQHNSAKLYEPRIAHFYNEFQDCLKLIRCLNLLFESPFNMGHPFFCLNGPFIYNLTVELSSRKDPVLYLSQLFGRQSFATNVFNNLLDLVFDGIDSNKYVRCLEVTNRRTHLKSQKIRTQKISTKQLNNRFAALSIQKTQ